MYHRIGVPGVWHNCNQDRSTHKTTGGHMNPTKKPASTLLFWLSIFLADTLLPVATFSSPRRTFRQPTAGTSYDVDDDWNSLLILDEEEDAMMRPTDVEYEGPDQYGQFHPIESPQLIQRKLAEFDKEIAKISPGRKRHLLLAQKRCPELLTEDFKLAFLRCELFHAPQAATRFVKYWQKRYEIMGDQGAFRPFTVESMTKTDKVARQTGCLNLLFDVEVGADERRTVAFERLHRFTLDQTTRESYLRVQWYLIHAALEHETTQRKGIIVINYPREVNLRKQQDLKMVRMAASLKGAVPIRLSAYHVCHTPKWITVFLPLVRTLMGKRLARRILFHSGTNDDIVRALNEFGLKSHQVPVEVGGEVNVDMANFFQKRQASGL